MKIIKDTIIRVGEGLLDAFKLVVSSACNLFAVMFFALVLNYVPAWVIGTLVVAILALIVYYTYKEELEDSVDEDSGV